MPTRRKRILEDEEASDAEDDMTVGELSRTLASKSPSAEEQRQLPDSFRDVGHSKTSSRDERSKMTQATISECRGIIPLDVLPGIPTTLYLGDEDVRCLRNLLETATERDDTERLLAVLRRLSAMPCTLPLLERSKIGLTVGRLRKHMHADVATLASRIVSVWKRQERPHIDRLSGLLHATTFRTGLYYRLGPISFFPVCVLTPARSCRADC